MNYHKKKLRKRRINTENTKQTTSKYNFKKKENKY